MAADERDAFDRGHGQLKWKNEINNLALILDQYQDLPILLFSAQTPGVGGNNAAHVTAKSIEKRTGKLLYEKELQSFTWFQALRVNQREGTIDLVGTTLKIQHYLETR